MDVLKDRQTRSYNYISRYASFPFYYNTQDGRYVYGTTSHLNTNIAFVEHRVGQGDTLDSLAFYYYGRPDLYWVIADFNRINDPLVTLYGNYKSLGIPQLSNVSYVVKG